MSDAPHVQNPLDLKDLYAAFGAADSIVLKKYISKLSAAPCIELSDELKSIAIGENISLYQVSKIIYDKNENTQDKLTTVYSTIFSLQNYGLAMLLNGNKDHVDLYLGVVTRNLLMHQKSPEEVLNEDNMQQDGEVPSVDNESTIKLSVIEKNLLNTGKVLKNAFIGNFPGTELKMVNNVTEKDKGIVGKADIIRESLKEAKYITAVSSVPAIRNANESKNLEFIQGLEKLIETMRGKKYSMIIIADAMSNDKIEEMCAEYEDIYSQLAPFKTSAQTINAQATQTDTEGLVKGITDTTNETIAKSLTHGTATAKTHTDSAGGSIGTGTLLPVSATANYSHAYSRTKSETEATTDTTSSGTAKSLTEQNSVSKSLAATNGESIQLNYENRAVKTLNSITVGDSDETVKFMVIEPAKGEYKNALAKNKKFGIKVYGTNPSITPLLRINPFRFPSDKIHIYEHLDKLTEIFNVCWPMYAAMPAVLKAAMENAYRSAGWNLVKSENKHGDIFPNFVDVALEVEKYINKSEYSDENKSNYKGSLLTRLESLTNGINSLIFTADDIEDNALFEQNVIVDLSRVGSMETKALIMGVLILKLQEHRIACTDKSNSNLRHVTVLEEAHNLLKRTSTEQSSETANLLGKSVEMLANSIAEMRTYGEGFIIADQSPGLLDMSVIRNTNTKIIMRLPDFSDRELVGKAAGLNDDQIIELAKLPRGVAAVYQNDWISPVLCSVEKPKKLKEEEYIEKTNYPVPKDDTLLFDLLDSGFRAKLDDLSQEEAFKKAILKSSVPTETKLRLMDYLSTKKSAESVKLLASMVFDHFKNAKAVLESTTEEASVEDLKTAIMAELDPSIMQFEDEQINILITLIIKEYTDRYYVDYPLWREFAIRMARGGII